MFIFMNYFEKVQNKIADRLFTSGVEYRYDFSDECFNITHDGKNYELWYTGIWRDVSEGKDSTDLESLFKILGI